MPVIGGRQIGVDGEDGNGHKQIFIASDAADDRIRKNPTQTSVVGFVEFLKWDTLAMRFDISTRSARSRSEKFQVTGGVVGDVAGDGDFQVSHGVADILTGAGVARCETHFAV